jgi:hypothetical protein
MIDHPDSDGTQQPESYPVIELPDERFNAGTGKPAEERHDGLKQPEMKSEPEERPRTAYCRQRSGGKRHREGIHCHAQGKQSHSSD